MGEELPDGIIAVVATGFGGSFVFMIVVVEVRASRKLLKETTDGEKDPRFMEVGYGAGDFSALRYSSKSAASWAVSGASSPSGIAESVDSRISFNSDKGIVRSASVSSRR